MKKESQLQSKALAYIAAVPNQVWGVKTIMCNRTGIPDVLMCIDGHFVAIEFKGENDSAKTSALQLKNLHDIEMNGGSAYRIDNLDTFFRVMEYHLEYRNRRKNTEIINQGIADATTWRIEYEALRKKAIF